MQRLDDDRGMPERDSTRARLSLLATSPSLPRLDQQPSRSVGAHVAAEGPRSTRNSRAEIVVRGFSAARRDRSCRNCKFAPIGHC
jgi:hypothetical protein